MGENANTRNVALVGPNGAGKTTLLESMLFVSGAVGRKGRVADGTTVGDASAEARDRRMSTELSVASFQAHGLDFTVLDCPGSVEFVQDGYHAVLGCDLAVVVVEPVPERMIATAPMLQLLDRHGIPHLVFVNKMDRSEVRYRDLLQALRQLSSRPVVPHQYAIGRGEDLLGYIDLVTEQAYAYRKGGPSDRIPLPEEYREREQAARREMLETLADFDDDLLEKLLEDQQPPEEQILRDLRKTLGADQVVPVFMGVAEQDLGVRRFVEALAKEAPDPNERAQQLGLDGAGPPLVQVLKNYHLGHAGKLSLARVWRGTVKDGMTLGDMRVGGVYRMMGLQQQPAGEAGPGRIVALARLEAARTGQLLSAGSGTRRGGAAARPTGQADVRLRADRPEPQRRGQALGRLRQADRRGPSTPARARPGDAPDAALGPGRDAPQGRDGPAKNKYNVPCEAHAPRTPYRETIRKGTQAHGRHKKQSGGHGQFADVKIESAPGARPRLPVRQPRRGRRRAEAVHPGGRGGCARAPHKGPLGFRVADIGGDARRRPVPHRRQQRNGFRWRRGWPSRRRCRSASRSCWSRS